jgi:hypothetical protein
MMLTGNVSLLASSVNHAGLQLAGSEVVIAPGVRPLTCTALVEVFCALTDSGAGVAPGVSPCGTSTVRLTACDPTVRRTDTSTDHSPRLLHIFACWQDHGRRPDCGDKALCGGTRKAPASECVLFVLGGPDTCVVCLALWEARRS